MAVGYRRSREQAETLVGELEALGARAAALPGDISQRPEAQALVRQAEELLGPLDALVCSAGVAPRQMLLTDLSAPEWREVMSVNLDSAFHLFQAAVPGFVRRQRGAIVTVSSMWGLTGGSCEAAYSASKAGIIGLTRAMAKELGPSHIRVNCVAPGVIATDMNAHLTQEDPGRPGGGDPSVPHRTAGGGGRGHFLPGLPRRQLHHGTGPVRGRGHGHLNRTVFVSFLQIF